MTDSYPKGTQVKWKWGSGYGQGSITERFTEKVTRLIKGSKVTRDADSDNPAYLIQQDDGDEVLKSESEIEKSN